MGPGSLTLLARLGAPVASKLGSAGVKKLTKRFRLAHRISKDAKKHHINVTSRPIRKWLARADTDTQLRECSEESLAAAAERLAYVIPGDTRESRVLNARRILAIIYTHYLKELDTAAALELSTHWQLTAVAREGERNRDTTLAAKDEVLARIDESRDFEQKLESFNEWRRDEANNLRKSWPPVERIVSILSDAAYNRGEILSSWADAPPAWLRDVPWNGYAFLSSLAGDYGQHEVAFNYAMKCLDEGGHPRGYWVARAAIQLRSYDENAAQRLCLDSTEVHPLLEAQRAVLNEDCDSIIESLEAWAPDTSHDLVIKAQLNALAWNTKGDLSKAIGILEESYSTSRSAAVGTLAAKMLLARALTLQTETRMRDAQKALSLAIQSRDSRRRWFGDSVSPLVAALQAAIIAGDSEKAWRLTQPLPAGDALPSEASDAEVTAQASLVAALTGRFEAAEELLSAVPQGFMTAQVRALIAEAKSEDSAQNPETEELWQLAWELAEDDQDRLVAAMGIAEAGGALPDLTALQETNGAAVQEIQTISRALTAGGEATFLLRANAHKSRIVVVKLAQRLFMQGELEEAADALAAGAARWRDAQLASMAAARYQEAGIQDKAREAANSALSLGSAEWAGAGRMYALLVEIESASGNVEAATTAARNLLSLDERDEDARWALIRCLMMRSDMEAAWHTMQYRGEPVSPRNPNEAIIWINLNSRFSVDPKLAGRALRIMKQWPDDERLLGVFIGVLLTGLKRAEVRVSGEDSELLQVAIEDFLAKFPNSRVFSVVRIEDEENPLASMAERMRDDHERLREVKEQAAIGNLPVGMVAEFVGRSYAEASLLQAAGLVFANFAPEAGGGNALEGAALPEKVVLDVTAAHTLAILDLSTADGLIGRIANLVTTDALYRDSMGAYESLSGQTDMSIQWDESADVPTVHIRSADETVRLTHRAQRIFEIMGSLRRVPWLELRNFPELATRVGAEWLSGLDFAKSDGAALWSDDRVLRAIGRQKGVVCFGTLDVLGVLQEQEVIREGEKAAFEALLIREHYVDIPFSAGVFELAAAGDGWRARGLTYSLTRPHFWREPESVMKAVLHAIEQIWKSDPSEITGWVASAGIGLVRVAAGDEAASRNLEVFLRRIMGQSWLQAATLPYVLQGFRDTLKETPEVSSPTQTVISEVYGVLVERLGHVTAANYLMALFSATDPADKAIASRVVLLHE